MGLTRGRFAGAAVAAWIVLGGGPVAAQISPGKLAKAHESLEGVTNCLKCHDIGAGPSASKCLACHKEIAVGIDTKHGYHYRTTVLEKRGCFECHSEHAGRNFDLVHWPDGINAFDHEQTGYPLDGKHAKVKCRDCHKPEFIVDDFSAAQEHVDLKRTFLGLKKACLGCHTDGHRGQLSRECEKCHGAKSWKPAPLFDHDRTKYPLTGKHKNVACEKCHPTIKDGKGSYVKYVKIATTCVSCHKDVHEGKFGTRCEDCHRTSAWSEILSKNFDHSRTRFPLKGRHARVECKVCHKADTKVKKRRFERCQDCHDDIHRGQFKRRADGGRCESCHTEDGFVPAHFTIADHDKTRFALAGAHRAQPCVSCHVELKDKIGTYHQYRFKNTRCQDCHEDIHQGQFQRYGRKKTCDACHLSRDWKDMDFDHDRDSTYPLVGAHRKATCAGCHPVVRKDGKRFVLYRPIDTACKTCHTVEGLKLE